MLGESNKSVVSVAGFFTFFFVFLGLLASVHVCVCVGGGGLWGGGWFVCEGVLCVCVSHSPPVFPSELLAVSFSSSWFSLVWDFLLGGLQRCHQCSQRGRHLDDPLSF